MLADQLQAFGDIHEHAGFAAFQAMVASYSFRPDYYNANRDKLLGPGGVWGSLSVESPPTFDSFRPARDMIFVPT